MGSLGHISGRGHLAIPAHPVPSHLPLTAAPSEFPPSFSPAASCLHLVQGGLLGTPPGPDLIIGRYASAPLISPLGGRWINQPSRTHPVP